jgi:NAD(P)-dependent dehydrogenase (short-subunit alcohol dehydrogenase family)
MGRDIAEEALAAGHSVVATTRGEATITDKPEYEGRFLPLILDVTTPGEEVYNDVVKTTVDRFGRIDVLVNNAGYAQLTFFEETNEELIRKQFETNVFGLMRVTRAVLPTMRRQRSGHIINISSAAGYGTGPSIYHTSKYAVRGFSQSLSFELEPFGIKVTNVAPGNFRTDFLDVATVQPIKKNEISDYDDKRQWMQDFVAGMNHGQPGNPVALAQLLVEVAASENPPLHLPVGVEAIDTIEQHQKALTNDIIAWREKSSLTDFQQ